MLALISYEFIHTLSLGVPFSYFYYILALGILFYHSFTIIYWVAYYYLKLLFYSSRTINRYYFEKDVKGKSLYLFTCKKQIINDIHPRYAYQCKVLRSSL